jgi:glycerol-3-phosphate acyltransferase PlsY
MIKEKTRRIFMEYVIVALVAYLMGCSNMALYLAKLNKQDLRSGGTGNLGASNATILMGWRAGVAVGIHDIGKSALAVILAELIFPDLPAIGALAGVASVLGHIFPFYLKFKGGKGFASFIGMSVALNWKIALVVLALMLLVTLITDYLVAGTMTTIVLVPVSLAFITQSIIVPVIVLVATAVIAFKHRENFVRLCNGTEIGLKSTIKGEHRRK